MNSINSDEFNAVVSFNEDYFYFLRMINHGLLIPDYLFGDIIIPVDAAIDNIGLSLKQVLTKNKDGKCIHEVASQEWLDHYMKTRMAPLEEK